MAKKKKEETPSSELVKMTIYLSKVLKDEMDNYTQEKGYSSRSEMLRQAFRIQAKVFPIQSEDTETVSIEEHFRRIEQRLEQIAFEQNVIMKEEDILKSKEIQLDLEERGLNKDLERVPVGDIPNFNVISNKIIEFIKSFPDQTVQDHILMERLRTLFPESLVWTTLVKLKNKRILKLEHGAWKINDT